MDGRERKDVRPGLTVNIVLKQDQRTGSLTRGVVKDVLRKSTHHPHGIKVRLESGEVGRVKTIILRQKIKMMMRAHRFARSKES